MPKRTEIYNATLNLGLESDIATIVKNIANLRENELTKLNYSPVELKKKFTNDEKLLKTKVSMYVAEYYTYILDLFKEIEGKNGFNLDVLSSQIKTCFIKMEHISSDKLEIFTQMTNWIWQKKLIQKQNNLSKIVKVKLKRHSTKQIWLFHFSYL